MIVTTARKGADVLAEKAQTCSEQLKASFIVRKENSVQDLMDIYGQDVLVVGKNKLTLHSKSGGDPFFYHPNSSMFRVKQFIKTGYDPLVETAGLKEGMSFLDCTLGLASDSLVAQLAVGATGSVTGLEANPTLAYIVRNGLQSWLEGGKEMLEAMRRINVLPVNHSSYLASLSDQSFDVVYFDPMFDQHLSGSTGIKGLKQFACHDDLNHQVIAHALRIAKTRVVLKDHFKSERFERFGFNVVKRQHAAFHYGYINTQK
ncbi:class I SAM-dependent methyltransferase [Halalkalibacter akibai]|uniref:L-isoD(D-D) O-methyltransferase n=1 Tax=Halalkalibacter akibai (strain ATCC 43226 / DSM 21942 / CIP 109018 / JCM 9157 / 1139) TaxID=1236973 RepID=W4QST1_HALA3|nr:class I SAM-dependent methyltransferase [Halalkalibacter akibai]GAE34693.1 L-isoD(D-D) O-methyltransferase [Halalkalibacter akibai JCM 9157]